MPQPISAQAAATVQLVSPATSAAAAPRRSSEEIAARSRSNLAFALACLPAERRRDMVSFYAFCRVVDDIADDPGPSLDARKAELARWRSAALGEPVAELEDDPVLREVRALPEKYDFDPALLAEIIDGVASDQDITRYPHINALLAYCYKVASVVGLVSVRIFGHREPQARDYAIAMGYALQLTNIMRDVGQDARETGRIYLPLDELAAHGVTEADILAGRDSPAFQRLMEQQYQRARGYFEQAASLLPKHDRHLLIASEMMGTIYRGILEKLRRNHYPSLRRRERLHSLHKLSILVGYLLRGLVRL